ncbi:MAG: Ig-like domain-containing protein [Candidatus Odinarchaeota archaeon]
MDSLITITSVTVEIHVPGSYFPMAAMNISNTFDPDPDPPFLYGMEMGAFDMGPGYTMLGDVLDTNITITLAFIGEEINATGLKNIYFGITAIALLDGTTLEQPEGPVMLAIVGDPNPPYDPPHLFTSSIMYSASDFEQVKHAFVEDWVLDEPVNMDNVDNCDYLHIQAKINSTVDMWIRFDASLNASTHVALNITKINKGLNWVDLWWPSRSFFDGGPFEVERTSIYRWHEDWENWGHEPIWYAENDYTTVSAPVTWETNEPEVVINPDNTTWTMDVVDVDGNGYDYAVVSIPANFSAYANYEFTAVLGNQYFGLLQAYNTTWFSKGTNTMVDLWFDIRELVTINAGLGGPAFLGSSTNNQQANLTIWNHLAVAAYPATSQRFTGSWDVEKFFTHANEIFEEDVDPLPSPGAYPFEITESLHDSVRVSRWVNIDSSSFSGYNILNFTLKKLEPEPLDYQYSATAMLGEYTCFNFSAIDEPGFGVKQVYMDTFDPAKSWYSGINRIGDHIWALATFYYRYNDPWNAPVIPVTKDITFTLDRFNDLDLPSVTVHSPVDSAVLTDEFGFLINATVFDIGSAVTRVDVYLSGISTSWPVASSDTDYWYHESGLSGPEIASIWIDEDGLILNYIYPDSSWVGSHDLIVQAYDPAGNMGTDVVPVTITDVPEPVPDDLIQNGLKWILAQQQPDGSYLWSREDQRGHEDPPAKTVAFTAWAMLTMLQSGSRYDDPFVQDCWNYIKSQIKPDGAIFSYEVQSQNYETSIALMGLIPLKISYQIWGVPNTELDEAIQNALNWLINAQNLEHLGYSPAHPYYGGWNYQPTNITESSGGDAWADLSNSQWSIIALAAARDFGLTIPASTWTAAESYVRRCFDPSSGGFAYQPGGSTMDTMNAAGIWCLAVMGYDDTDTDLSLALETMKNNWDHYVREGFDGSGYQYYALLSAAKALILTGHDSSAEYGWMYDSIYEFLTDHVIRDPVHVDWWFWDNTAGSEDPVYATLLAILSQQVGFGAIGEADFLSVTAECRVHLHLYDENKVHTGLNYTTGVIDLRKNTTYTGPSGYPQQITVNDPYKGQYHVYITAIEDGNVDLTISARTSTGLTVKAETKTFTAEKGHTYYTGFTLTTIYGVNIEVGSVVEISDGAFVEIAVSEILVGTEDYLTAAGNYTAPVGESFEVSITFGTTGGTFTDTSYAVLYTDDDLDVSPRIYTNPSATVTWTVDVSATAANGQHSMWIVIYSGNLETGQLSNFLYECNVTIVQTVPITYTLAITSPTAGETISGTTLIKWDATATPETTMKFTVEYSIDGTTWTKIATGITAEQYAWDTTGVADGEYTIRVSIEGTSTVAKVNAVVKNAGETTTTSAATFASGFEAMLGIISLVCLGFALKNRRK